MDGFFSLELAINLSSRAVVCLQTTMLSSHIDGMISHLLSRNSGKSLNSRIPERQILTMCQEAIDVLASQPPLLELSEPIRICGDIHGQYSDLIRLFRQNGFPPDTTYLFLGDYVDRGKHSLETICLLLCYKIKYPEHFFLLRGNHECKLINHVYGFYEECNRRYRSVRMWQTFQDVFDMLPFSALVGERILCMHGGLSPHLNSMKQLRQIRRPVDPKNPSMLIDLLWSDPDPWTAGWRANTRGLSYVFGVDVVMEMCSQLDIDMVVRAHQVVQDGYEFFASRKLVTIFSAPHYCGQFDNAAATMYVDENLSVSFSVLRPALNRKTSTEGSSSIRSARLHKRRHRL